MVYYNLIIEMYAKGISQVALADALKISEQSFHNKLYGIEAFFDEEIEYICVLFPNVTIEYLFQGQFKGHH